jgi:hypothetical protein
MPWHKEIWTYLIVTLVAVLIWAWAASETREKKSLTAPAVRFTTTNAKDWRIAPSETALQVSVEGPAVAVQEIERLLRRPVDISITAAAGRQSIDLVSELRELEAIRQTGATIVATDPPAIDVDVDQVDRIMAPVKANLPGVTTDGEVVVQPREVSVALPHSLRQQLRADFYVEAFLDRSQLDGLVPGEPQVKEARLRLPESAAIADAEQIRISPSVATVRFTIRSRVRETRVDSVRVQVAGPVEDRDAYHIEVDPKVLRGVTLLADADLSRQIEAGEVPVIAFVHLSSREKEAMIESKAVSWFEALAPLVEGGTRFERLRVPPGAVMPEIKLKITPRETSPAGQ